MRYLTVDPQYRGEPGPEEIALEGWVEDSGPYMSLSEVSVTERAEGPDSHGESE